MSITTKFCNIFAEWGFDERCAVLTLYKEMSLDKTCAGDFVELSRCMAEEGYIRNNNMCRQEVG